MKHCPIHGDRPRPHLCYDCHRLQGHAPQAPLPKLELTDSLSGQLEIIHLPSYYGASDRVVIRPTFKNQNDR